MPIIIIGDEEDTEYNLSQFYTWNEANERVNDGKLEFKLTRTSNYADIIDKFCSVKSLAQNENETLLSFCYTKNYMIIYTKGKGKK